MAEAKKFLDENGLLYYDQRQKARLATKVDKEDGKTLTSNDYTDADKAKLASIAEGATKVTVDAAISSTSENPVQNKAISAELDKKVDKVDGKGLSTNDYTTDEKNKLAGIETGAQVNVIESIKVNGTAATITGKEASVDIDPSKIDVIKVNGVIQTITDKTVDITMPTKLSDLTNDDNFVKDANYVHTDKNYTETEKNKLAGIAEGAQVNVIESVKVNGTAVTVADKAIDITVPTKVSDLTNDSKFQTDTEVQSAINDALKDITGIDFQVVSTLPATGTKGVIYLMANSKTGVQNIYDEYIWLSSSSTYEKIGTTEVDLSNYWNTTNLTIISNTEIDTIVNTPLASE